MDLADFTNENTNLDVFRRILIDVIGEEWVETALSLDHTSIITNVDSLCTIALANIPVSPLSVGQTPNTSIDGHLLFP